MGYFDDNADYLIYGPRFRSSFLSQEDYERLKQQKLKDEIQNRERALKNRVWRYWKSGINISSMKIEHLESAIQLCINNPDNPRYEGFLPLLQERLNYIKSLIKE